MSTPDIEEIDAEWEKIRLDEETASRAAIVNLETLGVVGVLMYQCGEKLVTAKPPGGRWFEWNPVIKIWIDRK